MEINTLHLMEKHSTHELNKKKEMIIWEIIYYLVLLE